MVELTQSGYKLCITNIGINNIEVKKWIFKRVCNCKYIHYNKNVKVCVVLGSHKSGSITMINIKQVLISHQASIKVKQNSLRDERMAYNLHNHLGEEQQKYGNCHWSQRKRLKTFCTQSVIYWAETKQYTRKCKASCLQCVGYSGFS